MKKTDRKGKNFLGGGHSVLEKTKHWNFFFSLDGLSYNGHSLYALSLLTDGFVCRLEYQTFL